MRLSRLFAAIAFVVFGISPASGLDEPSADVKAFNDQVKPFLARHCLGCHSGDKPKGDFDLSKLAANFSDEKSRPRWQAVLSRVRSGEMPPKEKPRPAEKEVKALTEFLAGRIAQGRAVLRRLSRVEYENTVRDLLGIQIDLQELLPPDSTANGFDTSGERITSRRF